MGKYYRAYSQKIDGVSDVSVNNGKKKAKISYDSSLASGDVFNKKLEPLGTLLCRRVRIRSV